MTSSDIPVIINGINYDTLTDDEKTALNALLVTHRDRLQAEFLRVSIQLGVFEEGDRALTQLSSLPAHDAKVEELKQAERGAQAAWTYARLHAGGDRFGTTSRKALLM